jgi:hypothetical protein
VLGLASVIAGHIVSIGADGKLQNFEVVGYVGAATSLASLFLVWHLDRGLCERDIAAALL